MIMTHFLNSVTFERSSQQYFWTFDIAMEMLKNFSLYLIDLKGIESGHFQQILQQKFDFCAYKICDRG